MNHVSFKLHFIVKFKGWKVYGKLCADLCQLQYLARESNLHTLHIECTISHGLVYLVHNYLERHL
jgi:hypothetical protein